ncbi:MAG: hypothetical protein ACRCWO_03895, partial [Bosea sp. (in: a-proteobacteria)]
ASTGAQRMSQLNIVIGTPSGRGQLAGGMVGSLMGLVEGLRESGVMTRFVCIEAADLVYARSTMATMVAVRTDYSHLLFVDDDMTFELDAILSMLRADKPLIGCICPKRTINLQKLYEGGKNGLSFDMAMAQSLEFIAKHIPDRNTEIRDGLCPVGGIGMGVTLIRRDCLTTMIEKGAVQSRTVAGGRDILGSPVLYNFFEQIFSPETDALLSEDLSFCERWTKMCGGEVWSLVNQEIGHIGQFTYKGRYLDLLKAGKL